MSTEPKTIFTPEAVLDAVSKELRYCRDSLVVEWDETKSRLDKCRVVTKDHFGFFEVYASESDASADCRREVATSLFNGHFIENYKLTEAMVREVAAVCRLSDLAPFITSTLREGWVDSSYQMGKPDEATNVDEIKSHQEAQIAEALKDPLAAVWSLFKGSLSDVLGIIIEQCSFSVDSLTTAILKSVGGWKCLTGTPVTATTSEGFVVVPTTDFARTYMLKLYEVVRAERGESTSK